MKKAKKLLFSLFCLAVILSLAIPISSPVEASPATIYLPDDYLTIQAAVDAASPGDIIIVRDGTYTENVDVYKDHLTIQSENGAELTVVQAANPDDHVFEVTAEYINIQGFTVKGATGSDKAGISLSGVAHCNISDNNASNNFQGIYLLSSSNNILMNNKASHNGNGIQLYYSSYNSVSDNNINSNYLIGIALYYSSGNLFYLNNLTDNPIDIYSSNSTNTFNSPEEITYTYSGSTYTSYLGNYWSDYATYLPPVGHSDPGDQWEDETLAYDGDINTYARVYVTSIDTSWLELLAPSGKATQGIRFWGSGGPLRVDIYYDGGWHCLRDWPWGVSSAPGNEWVELTYPSKIVEKARIKFHGRVLRAWRHLSEFQFKTAPSDADGDGIGDTPYSIDSDGDNYPLMEPFENYGIGMPTAGMHVEELHMTPTTWSSFRGLPFVLAIYATVRVLSDDGYPVEDAEITGHWEGPKGPLPEKDCEVYETTNEQGEASLRAFVSALEAYENTCTFVLDSISKTGYVYIADNNGDFNGDGQRGDVSNYVYVPHLDPIGKALEWLSKQTVKGLNWVIQLLPFDAFRHSADTTEQRKNAFYEKLVENDEGDAVMQLLEAGQYQEAIDKLMRDVRSKCDGSLDGNPKNDWITDAEAQQEICTMIDALTDCLEKLQ